MEKYIHPAYISYISFFSVPPLRIFALPSLCNLWEADRRTDRRTDGQTQRQTDRHRDRVSREEEARVTRAAAVGAGHQLLGLARLAVALLVPQTEVTVVIGDDAAVHRLLGCQGEETHRMEGEGMWW